MEHIMKLQPKYFEYIKFGTKRVELRLNDEKRKNMKIGDKIIFKKEPELKEELHANIINITKKANFKELMDSLNVSDYADKSESKDAILEDLHKFYSKEDETKYGVIGITVEVLSTNNSTHHELPKIEIKSTINTPVFIKKEYLYNIDLKDEFFNTLKEDYLGFEKWFEKKQREGKMAYITVTDTNEITSFLLLKEENEQENYSHFEKPFSPSKRIKVSTFKVSDTGKKIGEYFINIIINEAINKNVDEVYITTFEKQHSLISFLKKYGFELFTYTTTTKGNGTLEKEAVYVKNIDKKNNITI